MNRLGRVGHMYKGRETQKGNGMMLVVLVYILGGMEDEG